MKVVTIGRHSSNDVVIGDTKVSRHHLQIIRDDAGNFRVTDCGSTNGTYVNERKITGETGLAYSDVIRIGNTLLPWQNYFQNSPSSATGTKWIIPAVCAVTLIAVVCGLFLFLNGADKGGTELKSATVVKMKEKNGVRYIPAKVNGQELDFVFDTGASSICISTLEAMILFKNDKLVREDFIGEEYFQDATGKISAGTKIKLRTVTLGNRVLTNVEATIIENPKAECLFGQSVLEKFGSYKIDNIKKEIVFE
jgi:clan AA aspartic protease (TIGR02281 family)